MQLNKEQREAVEHGEGPLLIIAGAGTGKTSVITERVKYLIEKELAKPSEILALTFTEKAAIEMEERIDRVLPLGYSDMWVTTFHSFGDRVLRESGIHIGLDPHFSLMNQTAAVKLIHDNLDRFNLKYFKPVSNPYKFLSEMVIHFSRLYDEDVTPQRYLKWAQNNLKKANPPAGGEEARIAAEQYLELANAFVVYENLKNEYSKLDFSDLISKTIKLFRERPNILRDYQNKFKYILVDEYQDTNYSQNILSDLMAERYKNITVVGDDDQSIYRFRGAAISNILQFRQKYTKSKVVTLIKNYRSGQNILDKAYELIKYNNPDRLEIAENINKELVSQTNYPGEIKFLHTNHISDEVQETTDEIIKLVEKDGYELSDIAILVRANSHIEPFITEFDKRGIDYQLNIPRKLFDQSDVQSLVAFWKVILENDDSVSLYQLLSLPPLDINLDKLSDINKFAKKNYLSLYEGIKQTNVEISDMEKVISLIEQSEKLLNKDSAGQILYNFIEQVGLMSKLLVPEDEQTQIMAENVSNLFDLLTKMEAQNTAKSVEEVIDWISLSLEMGDSPLVFSEIEDAGGVNILTVHGSKGLEFDAVFMPNLVHLRFPSMNRSDKLPIPEKLIAEKLPLGDFHEQEERRLFYVGMTRARKKLYFLASNFYGDSKSAKKLSPFIFEALGDEATSIEKSSQNKSKQLTLMDVVAQNGNLDKKYKQTTSHHSPIHIDYLSYSQIETFELCPLHYKMKYILNIPTPASASLSLGNSVHKSMQEIYLRAKADEKINKKVIGEILNNNWILEGYENKSHMLQAYEIAQDYLLGYLKKEFSEKILPKAVEQPFMVTLNKEGESPLKVGGKIDRIDKLSNNKIEIIDYKTSAKVLSSREVDKNPQLTMYALAASQIPDFPFQRDVKDIKLSLYFFEEQKKISTTRTHKDIKELIDHIFEVRSLIEKSDFSCSGHFFCQTCEFKDFCKVSS